MKQTHKLKGSKAEGLVSFAAARIGVQLLLFLSGCALFFHNYFLLIPGEGTAIYGLYRYVNINVNVTIERTNIHVLFT